MCAYDTYFVTNIFDKISLNLRLLNEKCYYKRIKSKCRTSTLLKKNLHCQN
jgi:hypothetical protein